jgi:spermidine/putrescine transport system substrate-binding protein
MRRHPVCSKATSNRRRFVSGALTVAAAIPALGRFALGQTQQVNVYNWDTYIGETTLEDFTEATDIDVRHDLYASNDELFTKLRGGNPGYDVIFPTNDYVERMITAGMLVPLDHTKIPNIANIDPAFTNLAFDPDLKYSAPYFWGTVGARLPRLRRQSRWVRGCVQGRRLCRPDIAAGLGRNHPGGAEISRLLAQYQGAG